MRLPLLVASVFLLVSTGVWLEGQSTATAEAPLTINVRDFHALGDGIHDDSAAIQAAIGALEAKGRGRLVFEPFGTYRIGKVLVVSRVSNFEIDGQGATLKPTDRLTIHSVVGGGDNMMVLHCSKFVVKRLNYDGNRSARGAEETSVSLRLFDCSDFNIAGCTFTDAICDHLYLAAFDSRKDETACRDGVVENCLFDGAWRNAISVIHAHNIVIRDNKIRNVVGTRPQAGIDIEANATGSNADCDNANRDIVIAHNFFSGTAGAAVQIPGVKNPARVSIAQNNMAGSGVSVPDDKGATEISVCDNEIHDVKGAGIAMGGTCGVVRGNRLMNGTGFGIYVTGGQHLISGNTVTDFGVEGNGRCIVVSYHASGESVIEGNVVRKTVVNRSWVPVVHGDNDFVSNNFAFGCEGRDGPLK